MDLFHWLILYDSVRAYYTKVQYRYTGGNYLLWLKKIGYAEDKGYIRAVTKVLKIHLSIYSLEHLMFSKEYWHEY